jgi:hypothetical protein
MLFGRAWPGGSESGRCAFAGLPGKAKTRRNVVPHPSLVSISFVQSSRTKNGAGGTGLGLAICRKIMQALGGTITAANAAGGGARFTIELPQVQPRIPGQPTVPALLYDEGIALRRAPSAPS